ncbi:MAG: hypothetical protein AAFR14_02585 [Bacteroidota bacterium]
MSKDSRVWIWQSTNEVSASDAIGVQSHMQDFVSHWVSHQKALVAKARFVLDRFLIVVLDESVSGGASGCSIDSLTHEIQKLDSQYHLGFMDRTKFCFWQEGQILTVSMQELSNVIEYGRLSVDSLVFDNLVNSLEALRNSWLKPLSQSWHHRFA